MGDRIIHIFSDGIWHEELTNDWIRKSAFDLHSEQMAIYIEDALPWMSWGFWDCRICKKKISNRAWHGHIDGIVTDLLGVDCLYEHKGINHFTFQRYSKDTYPLDYFTQCALYLRGLRQDNPDLTKAVLLIKNKNTSAFLEYLLQYDAETDTLRLLQMSFSEYGEIRDFDPPIEFPEITHTAEDRFRQVAEHVKAKTLPERPHEYGTDFPCGYCQWEDTCWTSYIEEVGAFSGNEADLTDIEDTARFYNELGAQINDMDKQKKEIRSALIKELAKREVSKGKAGEYMVKLAFQKKKSYTVKASTSQVLRVNRIMKKEAK
ncbi:MAG: hypothetical protein KAR06_05590 [Deltaproteobacteria bacterium]|nr:hypothetical protein [Deltaproteobacteria bacterium]